jgi:hypothetical protein
LDKVASGVSSICAGLGAVVRATSDLVLSDKSGSNALISIIALLVLSNIYTYVSFSRAAPARMAKRVERENDLTHAVRMLLESRQPIKEPAKEAHELLRILDEVDARAQRLRSAVTSLAA